MPVFVIDNLIVVVDLMCFASSFSDRHSHTWSFDRRVGKPIPRPEQVHVCGTGWSRQNDWHGFWTRRPEDSGVHSCNQSEAWHRWCWGPWKNDAELFGGQTQIQTGNRYWVMDYEMKSRFLLLSWFPFFPPLISFYCTSSLVFFRRSCLRPLCLLQWSVWPEVTSDGLRWCTSALQANLTREWSRRSSSCPRVKRGQSAHVNCNPSYSSGSCHQKCTKPFLPNVLVW